MDTRLRALAEPSCTILRLFLRGSLPLAGRIELGRRLLGLSAAFFDLDVDQTGLAVRPTGADLEAIDFDGVLRHAADRLKSMADHDAMSASMMRRAEDALVELFVLAADTGGMTP